MQLATEVARLADVAERMLEREERREREAHHEQLREKWGSANAAPRRVGMGLFLRSIPGLAARFDHVVPSEFVAQTGPGEYEIACPCGETPAVSAGKLAGCECGRWFLHDGREIHVARFDSGAGNEPSEISDAQSPQAGP